MIKFYKNCQIDKIKWDNCIVNSVNYLPYALSWYLNIVSKNWNALVLGDYDAVFPLPSNRKFFIHYSLNPFWIQQLGIFSRSEKNLNKVNDFIEAIPKYYKLVNLNLNYANICSSNFVKKTNCILNLKDDYKKIKQFYSKNLKRNLKKHKFVKKSIVYNCSPKIIINLFRNNNKYKFENHDYQNLQLLMEKSFEKSIGQIILCKDQNNVPLAGVFLLHTSTRITFLFSGNTEFGRKKSLIPFLLDLVIQKNSNSNKIFDFEGSNNNNLLRFYKSFGAKVQSYYNIKINKLPFFLKLLYK